MTAGRELDALIAERVIGEHVHCFATLDEHIEGLCGKCGRQKTGLRCDGCHILLQTSLCFKCNQETAFRIEPLPYRIQSQPYSTSIAAAWQIIEKADLWQISGSLGDGPFITIIEFGPNEGMATADTAPLAICLAALRATGVQDVVEK